MLQVNQATTGNATSVTFKTNSNGTFSGRFAALPKSYEHIYTNKTLWSICIGYESITYVLGDNCQNLVPPTYLLEGGGGTKTKQPLPALSAPLTPSLAGW